MKNSSIFTASLPYPDKGDRKVWVYVPRHNEGEKLPVVYMTDGQNLFDENNTPYGCWNVCAAVEDEMKSGNTGVVIVGIDNGNLYRDNELTPKSIGEVHHRGYFREDFTPEGEAFDGFLMNAIVPYVESNFPVRTDRNGTAVCGSSSGGLQAFFAGIEHSEKFCFVGALSPAFLLYTEEDWRKYLLERTSRNLPYLFIYSGGNDVLEKEILAGVEMLYDLLPEVGYPYDMMSEVILFENKHNEIAWREIFPDVLHTFIEKIKGSAE